MKRKIDVMLLLLACSLTCMASEGISISRFKYAGPIEVRKPVLIDSLNMQDKAYDAKNLLKSDLAFDKLLADAIILETDTAGKIIFEAPEHTNALHLLSFYLNSDRYTKGTLEVSGSGNFEVYVNQKSVGNTSELTLEPKRYEVVIKYLTLETDTCPPDLKAIYTGKDSAEVVTTLSPGKRYTMEEMLEGDDFRGVSLSPDGKYLLLKYANRLNSGRSESYCQLLETTSGRILLQDNGMLNSARWMPRSNRFYYTRTGSKGTELVAVNPSDMQEEILSENLPKGSFNFSPDETFLLFSVEEEGPKEGPDLVRVLEPNDRLPGFRKRSFIWRYDLATGLYEQVTYGYHTTYINDVSQDSRYLLFSTTESVYTSRPHSRNSLYKLDLLTMNVDTIWEKAPYIGRTAFSPDGNQLMVLGAADAFGGIGVNIAKDQISNSYDGQLFIYDLISKRATPLTQTFNPSVTGAVWNRYDQQIYLLAEDKDRQLIFTCDPVKGHITPLSVTEEVISSYTIAARAPVLYYYGQSVSNANRLYAYDLKSNKNRLVKDLSAERLKDIRLGDVQDWDFVAEDGTTIQGRYYLPPDFDATKKYPLIVYYYGGTSPINRMLEARYSMHMYAALGYVVYTLNPSGTTGFGQEFSSRHVNAWGKRTADEIIYGTQLFCSEHSFIDEKKIGCIGASYGGFMTQYLQTRTDLFTAAISHAGISALSSYWGEGYWGYGYCSVANADSYPWNNPELFTEQSPLFQADKIHTPLLLLHGSVDTNVPAGESIQMFVALKLLGRTVEFIQVEGENHGIVNYKKRIGWQHTIFAWFDKWLKDQPAWWQDLYPERNL
ncbi:MAG: prolyl oligopeptidase family serine peptidase [Tannerellaceae bacterium]|nr:prolyl oligopeptidase family serine peptidase [Tannerellaceae bacterium]